MRGLDKLVILVLGSGALLAGLGRWGERAGIQHLILVLDQLISLADLESLDGLGKCLAEDLATMAGATSSVKGVGNLGIGGWSSGRSINLLVGRGVAAGISDVVPHGSASLVEAARGVLDSWHDAGRARSSVVDTSPRTKGLAVCPLHPVVLVAAELLGSAAEIVGGECLLGSHGIYKEVALLAEVYGWLRV